MRIVIREMPTRWGSCTPQNKIILNPELIKAPTGCIEYVIVHELCHLVYRNHTVKFMALQNKELPGWQKWKDKLEKVLMQNECQRLKLTAVNGIGWFIKNSRIRKSGR